MKPFLFSLCCIIGSVASYAQSNIPVINGSIQKDLSDNGRIVIKEPKVHITSPEEKVFAVTDGIIRMVSNFNVVIEANGMYYIYQDVKGNAEQLNKEVKRGDPIGKMYFNDEKKHYSLFISIMKAPKKYLTHQEVLNAIKG